jgi:hypothetical protein
VENLPDLTDEGHAHCGNNRVANRPMFGLEPMLKHVYSGQSRTSCPGTHLGGLYHIGFRETEPTLALGLGWLKKSGALVGERHNGGKRSVGSETSITRTFDR